MRSSPGFSLPHLYSGQNNTVLHCMWPGCPHSTPTVEVFNYSLLYKHIAIIPFCQAWDFFTIHLISLSSSCVNSSAVTHTFHAIYFRSCFSKPFIWVNALIDTLVRPALGLAKRSCCQAFLLKLLCSSWSTKCQLGEEAWESKATLSRAQAIPRSWKLNFQVVPLAVILTKTTFLQRACATAVTPSPFSYPLPPLPSTSSSSVTPLTPNTLSSLYAPSQRAGQPASGDWPAEPYPHGRWLSSQYRLFQFKSRCTIQLLTFCLWNNYKISLISVRFILNLSVGLNVCRANAWILCRGWHMPAALRTAG